MNIETLYKIIEKARENPQFFHALIFNPEQALKGMNPGADKEAITTMLTTNPEEFINTLTRGLTCNPTCDGSCDATCGRKSCSYTCGKDSCSSTAGGGCGVTIKNPLTEVTEF